MVYSRKAPLFAVGAVLILLVLAAWWLFDRGVDEPVEIERPLVVVDTLADTLGVVVDIDTSDAPAEEDQAVVVVPVAPGGEPTATQPSSEAAPRREPSVRVAPPTRPLGRRVPVVTPSARIGVPVTSATAPYTRAQVFGSYGPQMYRTTRATSGVRHVVVIHRGTVRIVHSGNVRIIRKDR